MTTFYNSLASCEKAFHNSVDNDLLVIGAPCEGPTQWAFKSLGSLVDEGTFVLAWALGDYLAHGMTPWVENYVVRASDKDAWARLSAIADNFAKTGFENVQYNNWRDMAIAIQTGHHHGDFNDSGVEYQTLTDEVLNCVIDDTAEDLSIAEKAMKERLPRIKEEVKKFKNQTREEYESLVWDYVTGMFSNVPEGLRCYCTKTCYRKVL